MSLAWRLGRAVELADKQANVSNIGPVIVDVFGGPTAARVLFAGKIVHVDRRVYKGHTVGDVTVVPLAASEADDSEENIYDGSVTSRLIAPRRADLSSLQEREFGPYPHLSFRCQDGKPGKDLG
jgi:hypothetical protein